MAQKSVFVYGSLMWPSVLKALLGRCPKVEAACLQSGFTRRRVPNQPYPGLTPTLEHADPMSTMVHGLVLTDLCRAETTILDIFEGDAYRQLDVKPSFVANIVDAYAWATSGLPAKGSLALREGTDAAVYVFAKPSDLDAELWAPDVHFAKHELEWVKMCTEFAGDPNIARLRVAAAEELALRSPSPIDPQASAKS